MFTSLIAAVSAAFLMGGEPPAQAEAKTPIAPRLMLLDAGQEPRQLLRYRLTAGDEFVSQMGMRLRTEAAADFDFNIATTATFRYIVRNVDEDSARFDKTTEDVRFDEMPQMMTDLGMAETMRDQMMGVRARVRIDTRGRVVVVGSDGPPAMNAQIQGILSGTDFGQGVFILPEEPIGPGAKWTVVTAGTMQGGAVSTSQTIRLLSIEGDVLRLSLESDETPVLEGPDMEGVDFFLQMIGDATLSLSEPTRRRMRMHSNMWSKPAQAGETPQTPGMHMTLELQMTSERAAPAQQKPARLE